MNNELFETNNINSDDVIEINGGNGLKHYIGINYKTDNYLDNLKVDWDLFKNEFVDDNNFDKKYGIHLINEIRDVLYLDFPMKVKLIPEFLIKINSVYNNQDIYDKLKKDLYLHDPISYVCEFIYDTIASYIDYHIGLFVDYRNKYIKKHKLKNNINDYNKIKNEWIKWTIKGNISLKYYSLLMICSLENLLKNNVYKNYIKQNKIEDMPQKLYINISNNKKVNKFMEQLKLYEYKKFCPAKPFKSLIKLMNFPLDELIDVINDISDNTIIINIDDTYEKILKHCTKLTDIMSLYKNVNLNDNNYKNIVKNDNKKYENICDKDVYMLCINYTDNLLNRYIRLKPELKQLEEYYSKLSIWLTELNNYLNKIFA